MDVSIDRLKVRIKGRFRITFLLLIVSYLPAKVVPQPIAHTSHSPRIQQEYSGERPNLIPISGHRSSPNPVTMEARSDNRQKLFLTGLSHGCPILLQEDCFTVLQSLASTSVKCTLAVVIQVLFRITWKFSRALVIWGRIGHS